MPSIDLIGLLKKETSMNFKASNRFSIITNTPEDIYMLKQFFAALFVSIVLSLPALAIEAPE